MASADLEGALSFPFNDENWLVTLLIGGALTFFGWLVFPLFILSGYFLNVGRESMDGAETAPAFNDWGTLFIDGLKMTVVIIIYQIVPLVVFAVLLLVSTALIGTGNETVAGLGLFGLLIAVAGYMLFSLVFGYVGLAGVMNLAREDSIGAAFDVERLKTAVSSKEWAIAWVYAFIAQFVVNVILGIIGAIPIIGLVVLLIAPFTTVYIGMVTFRLYGEGFEAAL